MSAQQLLHRSSFESSLTLHGSDDEFSTLASPVDCKMLDPWTPEKHRSPSATFQHMLRCVLAIARHALRSSAVLLPSFIRTWGRVEGKALPLSGGKQALAALNGLRGVACLIVFNYHLVFVWTHSADVSWGTSVDTEGLEYKEMIKFQNNDQKSLPQLPFLRLLYAGHAMVIIFFVISGYVLSHKPMKLMRMGKFEEFQRVLSSSVFRRGIRLFGPTIVGTFITMLFANAGYFEAGKAVREDPVTYLGNNEEHPVLFPTFYEQLWDWMSSMAYLISNAWYWDLYFNSYDPHLWTIPLEFRSSIVLFLTLLAFSRLRPLARLTLTISLIGVCLVYWARWEVFLFLAGMILAELDIISGIFTETPLLDEKDSSSSHRSFGWIWAGTMVVGLFLNSCPSTQPQNAPGYMYLATFVGEIYNWQPGRPMQVIGGCLIVWSFMHLPRVQRIFTTAVPQYLGQISYAFYIVHGPILHGFGYNFVLKCWSLTGKETNLEFGLGLVLAVLVILPLAIWAADLFWRAIDTPCVELAKWTEKKFSVEANER
jgi:peptidoglycan/LPS O-acetylase OafA/YrhL